MLIMLNSHEKSFKITLRRHFSKELRIDDTISALADILIRILNFEFGV